MCFPRHFYAEQGLGLALANLLWNTVLVLERESVPRQDCSAKKQKGSPWGVPTLEWIASMKGLCVDISEQIHGLHLEAP